MLSDGSVYKEWTFKQTYATRALLALLLLSTLMMAWAIAGPNSSTREVLFWVACVALVSYAVLWIAIGKTVLTINDQGVRRESILGVQEIPWAQLNETRYLVRRPVKIWAHFGLVGALVSAASGKSSGANLALTLIACDGTRLRVTSNFRKAKEAIGIIFGRVLPPMVATARAQIQRGETLAFGELALSATSVTWKNGPPIPVCEITDAEIVGSNLRLKRAGKWLSAVSVRSDKIPNVLVFLEVLDSVAPQSGSGAINPLARVRV